MSDQSEVVAAITALGTQLNQKHSENTDALSEIKADIKELKAGFPDDDPRGHRDFHDALIAESKARKQFWVDLRNKLIERGIWAAIALMAAALFFYAKAQMGKQ